MLAGPSKIFVFLLLLASTAYCQEAVRFALLPGREARAASHLCSRRAPRVDGGWEPTKANIESLEAHLSDIAKLRSFSGVVGARIADPSNYYRQYVGILVGKRKLIYVNAFGTPPFPRWRERFAWTCDGGVNDWGALYDPRNHRFFRLATNVNW